MLKHKTTEYVLVDIAEEMLEISQKRFAGLDNISHQVMDYLKRFTRWQI